MSDFAHPRGKLNLSSQLPPMYRGETLVTAATLGDTQVLWCSVLFFSEVLNLMVNCSVGMV